MVIFSRVLRDSTPRYVGRSVGWLVGRLVGWSVGWLVGNAFVRRATRRTLLAYLAMLKS